MKKPLDFIMPDRYNFIINEATDYTEREFTAENAKNAEKRRHLFFSFTSATSVHSAVKILC